MKPQVTSLLRGETEERNERELFAFHFMYLYCLDLKLFVPEL